MSEGKCDECCKSSRGVRCRGLLDCKTRYCSTYCRDEGEYLHSIYEKGCGAIIKEKEICLAERYKMPASKYYFGKSVYKESGSSSPSLYINVSDSTVSASTELTQSNTLFPKPPPK